ncbi:hypothetical protein MVEG_05859 [Podila verticillata NRRL 6337]|nr:hypothetical protein MVEG_05859 [Podila verticillata NRRL 6337]
MPPTLLPKILTKISLLLDEPHDLTQCALVCKSWSAVFTPCVWKSITITTIWAYRRFFAPEAQAALLKYARLVRELRTIYIPVIERIIQVSPGSDPSSSSCDLQVSCLCTYLTSLNLRVFWRTTAGNASAYSAKWSENFAIWDGYEIEPHQEQLILHLIKSNPGLRTLCIGGYIKDRDPFLAAITDASLPHLQKLDLFGRVRDSYVSSERSFQMTRAFLHNCPRTLQVLSLDAGDLWIVDTSRVVAEPSLPHVLLESLSVHFEESSGEVSVLLGDFIKTCSANLRDIHIGNSKSDWFESLQPALEAIGTGFGRRLEPEWYRYTNPDASFCQRLTQADDWTHITLTRNRSKQGGRLTANAVLERCGHLKYLNICECAHLFDSRIVHQILCRSTHLIELHSANEDSPRLEAKDFVQSWGCKGLKVLDAAIVDVPRPDITLGYDGRPISGELFRGTKEESREVQRRIFGQLAELKDLEVLKLGNLSSARRNYWTHPFFNREDVTGKVRFFDPDFQFNCLDMSLESGLYLLSELTEMRVLDVTGMAHRIGVAELDWMQDNWRKLERVKGLFDPWYPTLEPGVRAWLLENDPEWGSQYTTYRFNEAGTLAYEGGHCDDKSTSAATMYE